MRVERDGRVESSGGAAAARARFSEASRLDFPLAAFATVLDQENSNSNTTDMLHSAGAVFPPKAELHVRIQIQIKHKATLSLSLDVPVAARTRCSM